MLKKILEIVIIIVFISVLILAIIQRFYIPIKQEYYNTQALKNKSQYTIMCLGESTTQGQWPIQLQRILNDKYPNKFSVVDCALEGARIYTLLNMIDKNIEVYKPDFVICMMGINDGFCEYKNDNEYNNKYIKLIFDGKSNFKKILWYVNKSLKSFFKENLSFADEINKVNDEKHKIASDLFSNYILLKNEENFKMVESFLKKCLKEDPNDQIIFSMLVILYNTNSNDHLKKLSLNMSKEAIEKNFSFDKSRYYHNVLLEYSSKKNFAKIKYYANKIIKKDMDVFKTEDRFFIYRNIKPFLSLSQQEQILSIMDCNLTDEVYGFKAISSLEKKEYGKAKKYFDKAEEMRLTFPKDKTYISYKTLVKKMLDNNIKVICMQYPVRSVESLKEQLKYEDYFDKLVFVSNEQNFKEMLMKRKYNELFKDQVGADFGHCTMLGNTIIAVKVVETLENFLDLKKVENI